MQYILVMQMNAESLIPSFPVPAPLVPRPVTPCFLLLATLGLISFE